MTDQTSTPALDPQKIDIRMRAVELAEKTVHQPYMSGTGAGDYYRDKDIAEIISRAERVLRFVLETEIETQSGLIEKLRAALCTPGK